MCYVCSFVNKKYGEKCGCIFGYFWDEVIKVGVFVFCDDIGVKNVCVCGKMISNVYVGGNYLGGGGFLKKID